MSDLILIRNVGHEISESDIHQLFKPFGVVSKIVFQHEQNKRQALLKMEDANASIKAVHYYNSIPPSVRGRNMSVRFLARHDLDRSSHARNVDQVSGPKRVLSVTIHQVIHPVTVDALYEVFKVHGAVEKIIISESCGSQYAMIQYQSQEAAMAAFHSLHGRCIYDGCCQLSIQSTVFPELEVSYNDDRSRDLTNSSLPTIRPRESQIGRAAIIAVVFGGTLPPGVTGTNEYCTIKISNLNTRKIDEDKLFNLFSLYGKIVRIKVLHDKTGDALIEMVDGLQAELATHYLKGAVLFGKKMDLSLSKEYPSIVPASGSKSYFDSINHRFNNSHTVKNYRHCRAPTKMIYISHLRANISEDAVRRHVCEHGSVTQMKLSSEAGLSKAHILFTTEEKATEALVSKHGSFLEGNRIRISFSGFSFPESS